MSEVVFEFVISEIGKSGLRFSTNQRQVRVPIGNSGPFLHYKIAVFELYYMSDGTTNCLKFSQWLM